MLTIQSCELFNLPFFQFSQLKKYCPQDIPKIKTDYKYHWHIWKTLHQEVSMRLGMPFAEPHVEKWCNGWQVRAHFFAYYKYVFNPHSAAIFSVILNRRRLQVCLDWHAYRANRSSIQLAEYNQWLEHLNHKKYAAFDIWHGAESEYSDFNKVSEIDINSLILNHENDFFCIGKNIEKSQLNQIDAIDFIVKTIQDLAPLYDQCHKNKTSS
ncbi:glucose-6-phosphate 1-dehydrogenase family protein [Bibersteinia trehalosi]|uniref:glucose-6-phosphate 1-dehydrogenase family protein n=1 Tax=Bibersteinia trehalosi TaxID=47735 RepID=UPI002D77CD0C|nr:glucose-6-phosphate 1-dehydrogenase family protein [Bibersteinia trehalosi]